MGSRSLKRRLENNSQSQSKKPDESLTPVGIAIIVNGQEIEVKKELISGFGYRNGSRQKVPLEPKTFHQVINRKLKDGQICFLGPDLTRMEKPQATELSDLMSRNGLLKNNVYKVSKIIKEDRSKKKVISAI